MNVRRAGTEDIGHVATTLAQAFSDDPVVGWVSPRQRYERAGQRTFTAVLKAYMAKAEVHTTDDAKAAVIWVPPDKWKAPATEALRLLPAYVALSGRRLPRVLKLVAAMEARHGKVEEPHWYIPFIGTQPASQGKGFGSALLQHVLAKADEEGRPTYLEATCPRNQLLYHRNGFEVLDELRVDDSPPLTLMWRPAR